ncbi:MAG: ABC transporter permease, partial [Chlorobiaceae bacterium]|nr:ABC transporter permease [Chlorobiaceae bacterium]
MKPSRKKETKHRRNIGAYLFTIAVFSVFLAILYIRRELVSTSFSSLFTATRLLFESPDKLYEIFTADIIEFWIGAIYLVSVPVVLLLLFVRS